MKHRKIEINAEAICRNCKGGGQKLGEVCGVCEGSGRVNVKKVINITVTPLKETIVEPNTNTDEGKN